MDIERIENAAQKRMQQGRRRERGQKEGRKAHKEEAAHKEREIEASGRGKGRHG